MCHAQMTQTQMTGTIILVAPTATRLDLRQRRRLVRLPRKSPQCQARIDSGSARRCCRPAACTALRWSWPRGSPGTYLKSFGTEVWPATYLQDEACLPG